MGCFSDPLSWVEIYVQSWTNLGEQRKIDSDQVEVTHALSEIGGSVNITPVVGTANLMKFFKELLWAGH